MYFNLSLLFQRVKAVSVYFSLILPLLFQQDVVLQRVAEKLKTFEYTPPEKQIKGNILQQLKNREIEFTRICPMRFCGENKRNGFFLSKWLNCGKVKCEYGCCN